MASTATPGAEFQKFIYKTIVNAVGEKKALAYVSKSEYMAIWITAFTHETVRPTQNYEMLETVGDNLLKGVFIPYLSERYENIDNASLTNINNYYMGGAYQAGLARALGFEPFIYAPRVTDGILGDVFEAFVAALFKVSKMDGTIGRAYADVYNFVVWLFSNTEINLNVEAPKTFIQQSLDRLGFALPYEKLISQTEGGYVYDLVISDDAVAYFQGLFPNENITRDIARGSGKNKNEALESAYRSAFEAWQNLGITRKWVEEVKIAKDLNKRNLSSYVNALRAKMDAEGFTGIQFKKPTKLNDGVEMTISLILTNERLRKKVVKFTETVPVRDEARTEAKMLRDYIGEFAIPESAAIPETSTQERRRKPAEPEPVVPEPVPIPEPTPETAPRRRGRISVRSETAKPAEPVVSEPVKPEPTPVPETTERPKTAAELRRARLSARSTAKPAEPEPTPVPEPTPAVPEPTPETPRRLRIRRPTTTA